MTTPRRTYWFAFSAPNGYGGTFISPDIDPRVARQKTDAELDAEDRDVAQGDEELIALEFDAFHADLTSYDAPPRSSDPAPARLFARRLGSSLWYNPVGLSGGDAAARQEAIPIAMFKPLRCRGLAH